MINLTIETLRELCNGDASKLPRIIVHDNEMWDGPAMPDNKGRVHMSDKMMLDTIASDLPVKFIRRWNATSIEFAFDLQDHHLWHNGKQAPIQSRQERQELLRTSTGRNAKTGRHKDE